MRKSPAWTEQLRAIYPLPVMEVGVICRVRAFPPCQDAAESRGADQHASFGMPWLWQILPTTVQQNQDEKGICDFLKAKVWRREENSKGHLKHLLQARGGRGMSVCLSARNSWVLCPGPQIPGEMGQAGTSLSHPAMHRDKQGWHPSRAMDMLGQAGRLSPDFPCAISNIYPRDYKISYRMGIPLIKMQKMHIKCKTQAEKGFLHWHGTNKFSL